MNANAHSEFLADALKSANSAPADISHSTVFNNPMMKCAIIGYHLSAESSVTIDIYAKDSKKKIKSLRYIQGNPGGRSGTNKVSWDGRNELNQKVPKGKYLAIIYTQSVKAGSAVTISF